MTETTLLAWHFARADGRLGNGDGRELKVGETLRVEPPIALCERGLHASVRAIDALANAAGPLACRVELSGEIIAPDHADKAVATGRTVLAMVDATPILLDFIRYTLVFRQPYLVQLFERAGLAQQAESIATLDMAAAPLEQIQQVMATAWAAARATAWAAAKAAARAAAWAARDAAWAARDAAWAARTAARDARAAARDARDATWAARDAAWAAGDAAWAAGDAARDAAWAAGDAARDARDARDTARDATRDALHAELERLLGAAMGTEVRG